MINNNWDMKNDDEIIEFLIEGGLISSEIESILLKSKDEGVVLGDLIRATILGTFKANERAKETCVPMVVEENGKLFLINEDGGSKFLKDIEKPKVSLNKHFKLK